MQYFAVVKELADVVVDPHQNLLSGTLARAKFCNQFFILMLTPFGGLSDLSCVYPSWHLHEDSLPSMVSFALRGS